MVLRTLSRVNIYEERKDMPELAVLAPAHALSAVTSLHFQWAFSSFLRDTAYKQHFVFKSDCGHYIIICQDEKVSTRYLIELAEDVGAHEIAIRYEPHDANETLEIFKEAILSVIVDRKAFAIQRGLRLHFMATPQGTSIYTWSRCLTQMVNMYINATKKYAAWFPHQLTIGVSESFLLSLSYDDQETVISVLKHAYKNFHTGVHLLDWSGQHRSLTLYPFRSVSTVAPFKIAANIFGDIEKTFYMRKISSEELIVAERYTKNLLREVGNTR